jgi:hypothetical protein
MSSTNRRFLVIFRQGNHTFWTCYITTIHGDPRTCTRCRQWVRIKVLSPMLDKHQRSAGTSQVMWHLLNELI